MIYERWYWLRTTGSQSALAIASDSKCDVYYANDWNTLPIAVKAATKNGSRVIFDAHEYAPLEYEDSPSWKALVSPAITYIIRKYSKYVDASITVAPTIAQKYKDEFHLDPIIVMNAPDLVQVEAHRTDTQNIGLVHHGIAAPGRKLEKMIEALSLCDRRFSLHFILLGDQAYIRFLKETADRLAPGRVFFHDPVSPEQIVQRISEFDIGVFILEGNTYNHVNALPNKFCDFIAAGLAVCIGPSPEMASLIDRYGNGCVASSFEPADVARMLNNLDVNEIEKMKQASREAAKTLNAEVEMGKLLLALNNLGTKR